MSDPLEVSFRDGLEQGRREAADEIELLAGEKETWKRLAGNYKSLLANSEMTVMEVMAANERLRAALREALTAWQEGRDLNEPRILAALEGK